jgi:hypothetical protein
VTARARTAGKDSAMNSSAEGTRLADEMAVSNVRRHWAFRLDLGELDSLRECFHPGATVTVSWFSGPIETFIERTKGLFAARKPEEHRKHWLGNMRAEIVGTRAVLETDVQIMIREYIGDNLYDCTSFARFYDFMEKRGGVWRINEWQTIYDKDRVDPVVPSAEPAPFYAQAAFRGPEAGFAFMKLRQAMKGRTVPASLVIAGTNAEAQLRQRGASWLAGTKV